MTNITEDTIVWRTDRNGSLQASRCTACNGVGRNHAGSRVGENCMQCDGLGWFGMDPEMPISAQPGSIEKIVMLSVRYRSGLPLWNKNDGPDLLENAGCQPSASTAG